MFLLGYILSLLLFLSLCLAAALFVAQNSLVTWQEAQDRCINLYYHQAMVKDESAHALFKADIGSTAGWLSATDKGVRGVFRWSDGEAMNWTQWSVGFPAWNVTGPLCLLATEDGTWEDRSCDERHQYFCQIYLAPECTPGSVNCLPAPANDYDIEDYCFFLPLQRATSWYVSQRVCTGSAGLEQATIETTDHFNYVLEQLNGLPIEDIWIGLSSLYTPGVFRWGDQRPLAINRWTTGSPAVGSTRVCAFLRPDNNGLISNDDCDSLKITLCSFMKGRHDMACTVFPPDMPNANVTFNGTSATYNCHEGYFVKPNYNSFNVACDVCGRWEEIKDSCILISCGEPPTILGAILTLSSTTSGQIAQYVCESNMTLASGATNTSAYCDISGTWSNLNEMECLSETSTLPPNDDNSPTVPYTDTDTSESIQYATTSSDGALIDSTTEVPLSTQSAATFIAQPVTCVILKSRPHATVTQTGRLPGDTAIYTCVRDHHFAEGGRARSIVCLADGQWSAEVTDCIVIRCPEVPTIEAAQPDTTADTAGTIVTYTCHDGLRFASGLATTQTQCTNKGVWYPFLTACKERCPPLQYLDNAYPGPYTSLPHSTVTFYCRRGHRFRDGTSEKTISCQSNLQWEELEDCKVNRCPALNAPRNGTLSTNVAIFGTVVKADCSDGYRYEDGSRSATLECLENKIWNAMVRDCQAIICPAPPQVSYAVRRGDASNFGAVISYACAEGMRFEDGNTVNNITCLESEQWNQTRLSCAVGRCAPLPTLPNTLPIRSVAAVAGNIAIYRCEPGKMFANGHMTRHVMCDGQSWNTTNKGCEPFYCAVIDGLTHAYIDTSDTLYNTTVTVRCDVGYTFSENSYVTTRCNESVQWDYFPTECQLITCDWPPPVLHASRSARVNVTYGSIITYTCLKGYWLRRGQDRKEVRCGESGTWEDVPDSCEVITCAPLATWNGLIVVTAIPQEKWGLQGSKAQRATETEVNVTCSEDMMFADRTLFKMSTCDPLGNWQPEIPDCVERQPQPPFKAPIKEAGRSELIGTIAVCLVLAAFSLIVLTDAATIAYRLAKHRSQKWPPLLVNK